MRNIGCFRNSICNIFYRIVERSMDVCMVDRTKLKPCAFLCELFFIFLFLNYYHLYQSSRRHNTRRLQMMVVVVVPLCKIPQEETRMQ